MALAPRMRVQLLSKYGRLGASSRIRSYQYVPHLVARGAEITTVPLLDDGYLRALYGGWRYPMARVVRSFARRLRYLCKVHRFDLVWVEYELFPWCPSIVERALSAFGIGFVVDYDDAVFHRYDESSSRVVRALLGHKIPSIMRRARAVIAGNEYLERWATEHGARRVELIPSVVDTKCYVPRHRSKTDEFRIGWIGSPTTARYLQLVRGALERLTSMPEVTIVLIGPGKNTLDGVRSVVCKWQESTEVESIQGLDVGIMPLPDDPWERGKCGYKLVQYMACGIPVVASPVGANNRIVEHGTNGFLARRESDWVEALLLLKDNPELRACLGSAGRNRVMQHYSLDSAVPKLYNTLRTAAGLEAR